MKIVRIMFESADRYLNESNWRDLALIKFCVCSVGIMIGAFIPKEKRAFALGSAFAVFAVTYVPLMMKFFSVLRKTVRGK